MYSDSILCSANEIGLDPSRSYSDFTSMVEAESEREDGVEVVSIVTPNHLHASPAIAFLRDCVLNPSMPISFIKPASRLGNILLVWNSLNSGV